MTNMKRAHRSSAKTIRPSQDAKRKRIVVVGGGSYSWAPNLIKDMMLTEGIDDSEFILYDIDLKRAKIVEAFLQKLAGKLSLKATIIATNDKAEAFTKQTGYVIIAISTGGFDAMANDLAIPEEYGIYHTVGDTSGPGGWARAIRNFSVFADLGRTIRRAAPGAMILNYTNPMTTLTDILSRIHDGPVVGLCHSLFENINFLKSFYKVEETELSLRYAGINHFFWITEIRDSKRDLLADLRKQLITKSLTDLLRESSADPHGFHSNRILATELFRRTGFMSYMGDRHTCEFFPQYITNKKNMERYHLIRTTIGERRKMQEAGKKNLQSWTGGEIPEVFSSRSRETAADIVAAHALGKTFIDVGNVPNIGQIGNLPKGAVVETAVRVDRNGFSPIAFGDLPKTVIGLVEPLSRVASMVVDACFEKNQGLAMEAIRLDPVCSHLNAQEVTEMGQKLLAAHRKFNLPF